MSAANLLMWQLRMRQAAKALFAKAQAQDNADLPDPFDLPDPED